MKFIPAEVKSWDGSTIRIAIPGYTDGADQFPKAEICYPLADRPEDTGYKILEGDPIWIVFNGDDVNQPIVMGFRNKNTGANKNKRFLEHQDFELKATANMKQSSKTHHISASELFEVKGGQIVLKGAVSIQGNVNVQGNLDTSGNIASGGVITDSDGNNGA